LFIGGLRQQQNGLAQQDGGASTQQVPAETLLGTVNRNEQRQDIITAMVSCLLCYMVRLGGNRCVRAYRGEPVYLWQGVITLDFVPKSVCQGAAPLWNLCGACTHIRSETTKSYSILSITTLVPLATTPIILFAKVM